jgi:hypothetical protein
MTCDVRVIRIRRYLDSRAHARHFLSRREGIEMARDRRLLLQGEDLLVVNERLS